ncbi:hypothetical protein MKL09_03010 [Methylobacterium sp. J-048]|uniref:hypothetical protein n=1 Tax=Methylobacterium sp. J-048 TaxID=2836635 RepID=UPI001FB8E7CC|nr:hypothetical protein [Methylobacterium sp. J-048]MCJ2055518.1 hypothetical protein [Methylobacterium sp. J-048]
MNNAPANGSDVEDDSELIKRAVNQALDLRQTVNELFDPQLLELVDLVLIELGRRTAKLS